MKKWLVLALTCLMVLIFGTSTFAGTAYLDLMVGGNMAEKDFNGTNDGDLTNTTIVGFHHSDQKTKFAVEYLKGTWDHNGQKEDHSVADLRCGLQLFLDNFITVGIINGDIGKEFYRGYIVGLDSSFNLTDNIVFEGTAGFSFSSKFQEDDGNSYDSILNLYKIRIIYILTEHYAASVGYRYSKVSLDNINNTEVSYSGITLGLSARF